MGLESDILQQSMIAQGETLRFILFPEVYNWFSLYVFYLYYIGIDEINCLQVSDYRFKRGIEAFYCSQVAK